MKKAVLLAVVFALLGALQGFAQGSNTGMGSESERYNSLAQRILHLEKAHDACNIYLNFSACAQGGHDSAGGFAGFRCKQLRFEIKGNINDRLYYRFRHRFNKSSSPGEADNFALATDIMMLGYRFSQKWGIEAGKMCQYWGGFEYDANPIYVQFYSDIIDCLECSKTGVALLYHPRPEHELALNITNSLNRSFAKEFPGTEAQGFRRARAPLTAIANYNASLLGDRLQLRWSAGAGVLARHCLTRQLILGQKLCLPRFQIYLDYTIERSDIDMVGLMTSDLSHLIPDNSIYWHSALYNSLVTRADWQVHPRWNLFAKGMAEFCALGEIAGARRRHFTALGGAEYSPVAGQDFKLYTTVASSTVNFSPASLASSRSEALVELGLIYRIKCL